MMRTISAVRMLLASFLILAPACSQGGDPLSRARKEKTAVIGAVQFAAPYIYQSQDDFLGPEANLARRIGTLIGSDVRLVFGPRTSQGLVPSVVGGEVLAALGVLAITEERRQQIDFSDSYHELQLSLIVNPSHRPLTSPTDAKLLQDMKIGLRGGSAVEQFVLDNYSGAEIVVQNNLDSAVLALRRKEIDVVIDDRLMAAYSLAVVTGAGHLELLPEVLGTLPIAVAVPKENPELLALVNQAVAEAKGSFQEDLAKIMGDRLKQVALRYQGRIDKERQAKEPRNLTIRVSKDANYKIDIYKMANLRWTLSGGGRTYTSSPIRFRGPVGYASMKAPPNRYTLNLREFGFRASVRISASHPKHITVGIRLKASGVTVTVN